MKHIRLCPTVLAILFGAPLWLAACREGAEPQNDATPANVIAERPLRAASAAVEPVMPTASTTNLSIAPTDAAVKPGPDLSPEAAKGEKGARAVLLDWARALEQGDWQRARAQWGHGGADSDQDPQAFERRWQKYRALTVTIGAGTVEGGAGSLYYEVPVSIEAKLRDGRVARLSGPVVVRRVNDVDGATAEQLRWHIAQSGIEARP